MALGAPMLRGPLRRPCTTPALTRVPRRGCGRSRNLEFRVSHRVRNLISANSEVYHGAILTIRTSLRAFASVFPLTRRATSTSEKSLLAPSPSVLPPTAGETFEAA